MLHISLNSLVDRPIPPSVANATADLLMMAAWSNVLQFVKDGPLPVWTAHLLSPLTVVVNEYN